MLELKNVKHSYGEIEISYPDWKIEHKGQAMILGSSGSGKTTLLHLLCGLHRPIQGSVRINQVDLNALSGGALDRFRGENIGIVFQRPHLIRSLTVLENLELAVFLSSKKVKATRYTDVLSSLGIEQLAHRKVHQLSEGQAQRVSIARAVIHAPIMLAADEPTASLDDENSERVVNLLKEQAEACKAMLVVATHDARVKSAFKNQLVL